MGRLSQLQITAQSQMPKCPTLGTASITIRHGRSNHLVRHCGWSMQNIEHRKVNNFLKMIVFLTAPYHQSLSVWQTLITSAFGISTIQESNEESPFHLLCRRDHTLLPTMLTIHVVNMDDYYAALTVGLSGARKGTQDNIRRAEQKQKHH